MRWLLRLRGGRGWGADWHNQNPVGYRILGSNVQALALAAYARCLPHSVLEMTCVPRNSGTVFVDEEAL